MSELRRSLNSSAILMFPMSEKTPIYDFICDRLIPGCTHEDHDKKKAQLAERAAAHMREHHGYSHVDEPIGETLERTGAIFIRPA